MEDLNDKVTGGTLTAPEWNQVPSEIQNVIEDTGQTLTNTDLNQLGKGLAQYSANGDFYTDSGAANAYALSTVNSKQSTVSYVDGMRVRFIAANTSTAASTVNVSGIGSKGIVLNGQAITGAEISGRVSLIYDLSNDRFDLVRDSDTPVGYINGLITSNAADADHDITIDAGIARDSGDSNTIQLTSPITKQIDAVWAEGTNLGGRASAVSLSVDTWYHLFVISKADGTVDAGWDTDIDATNLLSDATGFDFFRLIASNLTDGSSNILAYKQVGNRFEWVDRSVDFQSGSTGVSAILVTLSTPVGRITTAKTIFAMDGSTFNQAILTEVSSANVAPSLFVSDGVVTSTVTHSVTERTADTNTLSQVRIRASASGAGITLAVITLGWTDYRGSE